MLCASGCLFPGCRFFIMMFGVLFQCTVDGNAVSSQLGFLFQFLWCSQTGDHPQEEIAKFGYMPERKVQHFKNPPIFWQLAGTHCLNVVISEKKFLKIWQVFSPTKIPLYPITLHLFLEDLNRKLQLTWNMSITIGSFLPQADYCAPVKLVSWWILFWNVHYMNQSGFCGTFNIHVWNAQ